MVISIMIVIVVIIVAVPMLMASGAFPSVGAVEWRDDAAAQNDGSTKQDNEGLHN